MKPLYRKVGGLHFIRLGRFQVSFCLCRDTSPLPDLHAWTMDGLLALAIAFPLYLIGA